MQNVRQSAQYTNLSASAAVKSGTGVVYGFVVNSHTGGTLKLWDNTSASTTVLFNTITFAAGSFNVTVINNNVAAGTAETGAIVLNFAVIKAVTV